MKRIAYECVIVGGGSAGLAAAWSAKEHGAASVLVIEREAYAGGVLPQCVHDGFGLHVFGENLTGPEYAERWIRRAQDAGADIALSATVLDVRHADGGDGFELDVLGRAFEGRAIIEAKAVVVATGCRERTRGSMQIPGMRPAGVMCAGTAQYMINVANQMPGRRAVVLGSGDIGLIMARRLTLEGAKVALVLGQEATGLLRNHIRCIEEFGIPIRYGWGVCEVLGRGRVEAVKVAPLLADGSFDLASAEEVSCDMLLVACGLIPEREVLAGLGRDCVTSDEDLPLGVFTCGNAKVPHDLVDQVTVEGVRAGHDAAAFAGGLDPCDAPYSPSTRVLAGLRIRDQKGALAGQASRIPGERRIVCTMCPNGCVMTARGERIEGFACARGQVFAEQELSCPVRLFTGTVRVEGGSRALVPVRTSCDVPRSRLFDVADAARAACADAPVRVRDVVLQNVAGTGADLIATANVF